MNDKARSSIFFVVLLLIISLAATGFYFVSYEKERQSRQQLQQHLDLLKHEKERIQKQLELVNNEKVSLEQKVKENEVTIADLGQKLTQEVKAKETLLVEQKSLQDKILGIEQEKKSLNDRLNAKLTELDRLRRQLASIASEKDKLEKAVLNETKENKTEDLEKIVVSSQDVLSESIETKEAKPPIEGKVLLINREYKFLILDVGIDNGVELEDVFEVSHNATSIGRVQIEKLHAATSAAKFLEDLKEEQVSEADIAKRIN